MLFTSKILRCISRNDISVHLFGFLINKQLSELLATKKLFGVALIGAAASMGYKEELVNNISDAIKTRFETMQIGKCGLEATKILKLKSWPTDKEELRGRLSLFHVFLIVYIYFRSTQ